MDNRFISNCTNIKLIIQCGEFMKTIVINADPKMKQEIGRLLKSAGEGAESVGSTVEYFDLYKLNMRGCMLCSICKRKNKESFKCYWRDELSPIIEKILNADTLLIGSQNSLMNRQAIIGHWLKDLYTALFHMIETIIIKER